MYFSDQEPTGQINFRKKLAKTLFFNMHYNEDDDKTPDKKRKQREYGHCLITLPKNKKFSGTRIVTANSEYPQHKCNTCKKRVHTYCLCSPGPVCRMFRLPSCMYRKQSFHTGLNSVAHNPPKNGMPMTINSSRPTNI